MAPAVSRFFGMECGLMLVPLIKPAAAYDVPPSATNNAKIAMPWRRMRFPMTLIPLPPCLECLK
jgi:hypothetical protein